MWSVHRLVWLVWRWMLVESEITCAAGLNARRFSFGLTVWLLIQALAVVMLSACSSGGRSSDDVVIGVPDLDAGQDSLRDPEDSLGPLPDAGDDAHDVTAVDGDSDTDDRTEPDVENPCGCSLEEVCVAGVCRTASRGGCKLGEVPTLDGRCLLRCEDSSTCAPGSFCEEGRCSWGCEAAADCGANEQCEREACVASCGERSPCAAGQCIAGVCRASLCASDCGAGARCVDEVCIVTGDRTCDAEEQCARSERCIDAECQSVAGEGAVFASIESGLDLHRFGTDGLDELGFGGAIAPGDFDGDGDIDLALAIDLNGDGCVYWNRDGRFERAGATCNEWTNGESLSSADLDGDGRDELLIGRVGGVGLFSPADGIMLVELDVIDEGSGAPIFVASLLPFDVDADGQWELLAGTSIVLTQPGDRIARAPNFVVSVGTSPWSLTVDDRHYGFEDRGQANTFAVFDWDDDGLHEVMIVNDSFSSDTARNTSEQPGLLMTVGFPGSSDVWAASPILPDEKAWGSFMGAVWTAWNGHDGLYLTDRTSNRFLVWEGTEFAVDLGAAFNLLVDRAGPADSGLFSWSVISADFDLDDDEDLLISQGSAELGVGSTEPWHQTTLLIQNPSGAAARIEGGFGFSSPVDRLSDEVFRYASSRAALALDLDADGRLEVVMTHLFGAVEHYEEVGDPSRCAVLARSRVVLAAGWGVDWAPARGARWRRSNNFGHTFSSPGPTIVADRRSGVVRFPSGAVASFDCEADQQLIVESDWIARETGSGDFRIDAAVLELGEIYTIAAVIRFADGTARQGTATRDPQTGLWRVTDASAEDDIMLRINGRWVRRWWSGSL